MQKLWQRGEAVAAMEKGPFQRGGRKPVPNVGHPGIGGRYRPVHGFNQDGGAGSGYRRELRGLRRYRQKNRTICLGAEHSRPIVRFFPGTARIDKDRYPDIAAIIKAAQQNSLTYVRQEVLFEGEEVDLGPDSLELVRKKGYSMLWLLPDDDFELGLRAVEEAL